jgi:N-[(2S)-2-amino-2-carboxyethyl]-L-glutamate dehydrogenase
MGNDFHVVPGREVRAILDDNQMATFNTIRQAYLLHHKKESINPHSYFFRFPDNPGNRVIALPAYLGGPVDTIGIKWIASFPGNLSAGLPRASAVLILNDAETGLPIACLEGAAISAARTGASAALAAMSLRSAQEPARLAFIGSGVIARAVLGFLRVAGFRVSEVSCYDLDQGRARAFVADAAKASDIAVRQVPSAEEALESDVVVLATTATAPYLPATTRLRGNQLVLNISLRDLPPELICSAANVLDDVDHCLTADTSVHLAERLSGGRDFVTGTLGDILTGNLRLDTGRPVIFSPFGLGILDVALGSLVLAEARRRLTSIRIPGFCTV